MVLLLLLIIFVIGFFVAAANSDYEWSVWVAIVCGIGLIVCIMIGAFREEKNPVEIMTKQSPQIDTTITYSNGVADTVYIYHIIEKK